MKINETTYPTTYSEQRPWGNFEKLCQNTPCTVKIIQVNPNEELSLQYHNHRDELWKVVLGEGIFIIGEEEKKGLPGDIFFIPRGIKHQVKTKDSFVQLIEVSFGMFAESDIIRLKDKYNRVTENKEHIINYK